MLPYLRVSRRGRPTGPARLARAGGAVLAAGLVLGAVFPTAAAATSNERHRYIVMTKTYADSAAMTTKMSSRSAAGSHTYQRVFPGFSAKLSALEVTKLRRDPDVRAIVVDQPVSIAATTTTQSDAPWGLDRIDQRSRTVNGKYSYGTDDGHDVTAIVLDTGINFASSDFRGRIRTDGTDYVDGDNDPSDCNGHGTHVAGTIAGTVFGVAKKARILPMRILDCEGGGFTSDTVAALDQIASHAKDYQPAVVNMSLGGAPSNEVDAAVNAVIAAGIPVVVAAGNADYGEQPQSACSASPARVPKAITVGATGRSDKRAGFSYFGPCVDIWAPGVDIESDWIGGRTATQYESGTSMATPHVAGVIARYLSVHPASSPSSVRTALVANATPAAVSKTAGSPGIVLFGSLFAPPSAPSKVTGVSSATSLAARLTWSPPATSGGSAVEAYEVRRSGTDAQGRGFTAKTVPASRRGFSFTGLKAATTYTLSVTAVNDTVRGSATTVRVTTLSKPGVPRVSTPSAGSTRDKVTSITAHWRAAAGPKPTIYSVAYRRAGTGSYTAVKVPGSKTSVQLAGLVKNARYVVTVRAGNAAGSSAASTRTKTAVAR